MSIVIKGDKRQSNLIVFYQLVKNILTVYIGLVITLSSPNLLAQQVDFEGQYIKLRNMEDDSYMCENSGNLQTIKLEDIVNWDKATWIFKRVPKSPAYYRIENKDTGKFINTQGGLKVSDISIDNRHSLWKPEMVDLNGRTYIRLKNMNGEYLFKFGSKPINAGDITEKEWQRIVFWDFQEPKSIHTWLDSDKSNIYNYDIDIRIVDFPLDTDSTWLYFFSLLVTFTDHDEWSHGGFQLAKVKEFKESNYKGVNWGGGSDWAGYAGIGKTNTAYTWEVNKWYRYRVWRMPKDENGFWHWEFWVLDYDSGVDKLCGTVKTKSEFIYNADVWIETGYGVQCHTEKAQVEWRNPVFKCLTPGEFSPNKGTAAYNGTCDGINNTNQGLISEAPLLWFQTTNSRRTVKNNTVLWNR